MSILNWLNRSEGSFVRPVLVTLGCTHVKEPGCMSV